MFMKIVSQVCIYISVTPPASAALTAAMGKSERVHVSLACAHTDVRVRPCMYEYHRVDGSGAMTRALALDICTAQHI